MPAAQVQEVLSGLEGKGRLCRGASSEVVYPSGCLSRLHRDTAGATGPMPSYMCPSPSLRSAVPLALLYMHCSLLPLQKESGV